MNKSKNLKIWASSNIFLVTTALFQLGGFIILGRALGAIEYGTLLAVTIFVSLAVEFVGLGCGDSLIKIVSTDAKKYPMVIRESLILSIVTLLPVCLVVTLLLYFFSDSDPLLVFVLVLTELFSTRALALVDHSSIANTDIASLNRVKLSYAIFRFFVIIIASYAIGVSTAWQWVPFQVLCSVIVTAYMLQKTVKKYGGLAKGSVPLIKLRESIIFSFTQTSRAIQSNVDKYAVQFAFDAITFSLYAVAGRFVQYSLIPLQAVLRMSYPSFFIAEKEAVCGSLKLAVKVLPLMFLVSLVPFSFLKWGGFVIEILLGGSYKGVSGYMTLLAPIPVLLGIQYIFMDVLTALGSHKIRLIISLLHVTSLILYFFISTALSIDDLIKGFISVNFGYIGIYLLVALYKAYQKKRLEAGKKIEY
jgi:O-antigen/teichoic acid export membrane protein